MTLKLSLAAAAAPTADAAGPPKIKRNASRKNKKSWRKNVDMAGVEEYMEEKSFEDRVGGSFASRPDSQLFVVDNSCTSSKVGGSKVDRRRKRKEVGPLRCFSNLNGFPGAADPVGKRDRVRTAEERMNPLVKAKLEAEAKAGRVGEKRRRAQEAREAADKQWRASEAERTTRRRTKFDFDLWSDGGETAPESEQVGDGWVEKETLTHTALGHARYTPRDSRRVAGTGSKLPAVELPHPGASYNPSAQDHNDLLWKATMVELEKEREIARIERATTAMFPSTKEAPTEKSYLKEMSEGIPELGGSVAEEDEEEEGEQSDNEPSDDTAPAGGGGQPTTTTTAAAKPKTRKQVRNARAALFAQQRETARQAGRLKEAAVYRLKTYRKELAGQEAATRERQARKAAAAAAKLLAPGQLSNYKYEAPDLEVKLSDELTGNLRSLRAEGSLLEDRYKSLQRRNIIETRVKQKIVRNPHKRKKVEKRSYKMGWEAGQLPKRRKKKQQQRNAGGNKKKANNSSA